MIRTRLPFQYTLFLDAYPFSFPYKYTFLGEIEHEKRRLKI